MPRRDPILTRFGLRLRQCREARDFTQERLAERVGLNHTEITSVEPGFQGPGISVDCKQDGGRPQARAGSPSCVR